jgi:hypothetical protein
VALKAKVEETSLDLVLVGVEVELTSVVEHPLIALNTICLAHAWNMHAKNRIFLETALETNLVKLISLATVLKTPLNQKKRNQSVFKLIFLETALRLPVILRKKRKRKN